MHPGQVGTVNAKWKARGPDSVSLAGQGESRGTEQGLLCKLSLGLQEKPPECQEVLAEHCRATGGLWASTRTGQVLDTGIVVEKPGAGAGSGAGPTPGLRGRPTSGPQGPGVKAGLNAVGPCESASPIGRTLHRPERHGPLESGRALVKRAGSLDPRAGCPPAREAGRRPP